jgi:hypothetical protein
LLIPVNPDEVCSARPTRQLAEGWTYRFLAAAHVWAITEHAVLQRISLTMVGLTELDQAAAAPEPSTAEVRAWPDGLRRRDT